MTRTALLVAPLVVLSISTPVRAQMTVNPSDGEKDGLTVASAQQVAAKPTKLRMFTALTARDEDARRAVVRLAEKKKSLKDKLQSLPMKPADIKSSPTRILEWVRTPRPMGFWSDTSRFALHISEPLLPNMEPVHYTAYVALQVDWEIKEQASDELIVMPIELIGRIRKASGAEDADPDQKRKDLDDAPSETYMMFVGEVSEEAGTAATKRAYDEANAQAMKLAATTGRGLGKLVRMSPRVDGASYWDWDCRYSRMYFWGLDEKATLNPMSEFRHSPSEVFSADPTDLYRTYSIELRFELK